MIPPLGTALVLLSGDENTPVLGRSWARRMARKAKHVGERAALDTATGGAYEIARRRGTIHKELLGAGTGLLGRSFAQRMASKARGVAHATLNVATKVPGISGIAQGVREAGSVATGLESSGASAMPGSDAIGKFIGRQVAGSKGKAGGATVASGILKSSMGYLELGGGILILAGITVVVLRNRRKKRSRGV